MIKVNFAMFNMKYARLSFADVAYLVLPTWGMFKLGVHFILTT